MAVLSRVRKLLIALGALGITLACMQPALLTPTPEPGPTATLRPTQTMTPTSIPNAMPLIPNAPTPRVRKVLGKWNMRSGPGMVYPMILILEDVDVRILESRVTLQPCTIWYRIEIDRTFGWVCSEAFK